MSEDIQRDEWIPAALWVGSPQTVAEHSRLYDRLISGTKQLSILPGPIVVFDGVMMPIEELIEAFTTDDAFVRSAAHEARLKGINDASMGVLLFAPEDIQFRQASVPDGELTYLGTFEFPTDDLLSE